ncbi:MAG TPA: hypothetical protein VMB34_05510 [Acetobacteraceae bacterium]|nr:hypothetical protein [Acetobacteraceae bacterium]
MIARLRSTNCLPDAPICGEPGKIETGGVRLYVVHRREDVIDLGMRIAGRHPSTGEASARMRSRIIGAATFARRRPRLAQAIGEQVLACDKIDQVEARRGAARTTSPGPLNDPAATLR